MKVIVVFTIENADLVQSCLEDYTHSMTVWARRLEMEVEHKDKEIFDVLMELKAQGIIKDYVVNASR